jgi:obg-like ATPase 1
MIPFSGVFERSLADMAPDEAAKYCEENKLQRLGIKEQHLANE